MCSHCILVSLIRSDCLDFPSLSDAVLSVSKAAALFRQRLLAPLQVDPSSHVLIASLCRSRLASKRKAPTASFPVRSFGDRNLSVAQSDQPRTVWPSREFTDRNLV